MAEHPQQLRAARRGRIVRMIWAACLLLAACNHALILIRHGLFWDYGGIGGASALYWSSLTLLDPIAAALLFARPRIGVGTTALLITTNVGHNLWATARYTPDGASLASVSSNFAILCQIGFLLFVLLTARVAWRGAHASSNLPGPIRRAPSGAA